MGRHFSVFEGRSPRGGGLCRRMERVSEASVKGGGEEEGAVCGGEAGGGEGRGGRERERGGKLEARAVEAWEERWERRRWEILTSTPWVERRKEAASLAQLV